MTINVYYHIIIIDFTSKKLYKSSELLWIRNIYILHLH